MHLEDHAGDIIRKARQMAGLSLEQAARAAGWAPGRLAELEARGVVTDESDLPALSRRLGLDGDRLSQIARGWHPASPDLSKWRELRRITTRDGGLEVHCYLVWDEVTREAALFDTGLAAGPVMQALAENDAQLKHVFITHSHYDHVQGLTEIREKWPRVLLHTSSADAPPQHRNRPNEFVSLGSLRVTHRETPGHAADGVAYLIGNWPEDAPCVAVVGDALFAGSMGGVPAGGEQARAVIRRQLLSLPPDTLICPGHGPFTTVAEEREHNPFFA